MSVRMVNCAKLGRVLPGLMRPPFSGALGQRIYENISQEAWQQWRAQSVIIINHHGLNLGDPRATKLLLKEMETFLFSPQASEMPEEWVPDDVTPNTPPPRA